MCTRGNGSKKSKNFVDIINGSPKNTFPNPVAFLPSANGPDSECGQISTQIRKNGGRRTNKSD